MEDREVLLARDGAPREGFSITPILGRCARSQLEYPIPLTNGSQNGGSEILLAALVFDVLSNPGFGSIALSQTSPGNLITRAGGGSIAAERISGAGGVNVIPSLLEAPANPKILAQSQSDVSQIPPTATPKARVSPLSGTIVSLIISSSTWLPKFNIARSDMDGHRPPGRCPANNGPLGANDKHARSRTGIVAPTPPELSQPIPPPLGGTFPRRLLRPQTKWRSFLRSWRRRRNRPRPG